MSRSLVLVLVMAGLAAGCAFGRKQDFQTARLEVSPKAQSINLAVLDHRPYVLDKSKPETFTGISRGGIAGVPYNINTESGQPVAQDMATAVANALRAKGATVTVVPLPPSVGDREALARVASPGGKGLLVVLKEWKSDTYVNATQYFDVSAYVVDAGGKSIGENRVEGVEELPYEGLDTRITAPIKAFARKMQQLLAAPAIADRL